MAKSTQTGQLLSEHLETSGPMHPDMVWLLMKQLIDQVGQLHTNGQLHRKISTSTVWLTQDGLATLQPPMTELVNWAATGSTELLPSDLEESHKLRLPHRLEQATRELNLRKIQTDPRRIDVYQLGQLALEMLTGESVANYLMCPKVKAAVPAPWRAWIDSSLGFTVNDRAKRCEQLHLALESMTREKLGSGFDATPPAGTGVDVHRDTPLHGSPLPSGSTNSELPITHLGHYRIDAKLGSGGMGDVYRGYDPRLDRTVAVKVLPSELARNQDFVRRFNSEARAAAQLAHPHIVPIYFISEDQGTHFFAMEYVDGHTLADVLKSRGVLDVDHALELVEQVTSGLAVAHARGLIHRDIKPGNILLDRQTGQAKIADFGLVKSLSSNLQATATGVVMGTVDYISPEQGRGQVVDGRSDLYSVGVLLYQLLSGKLPFEADSPTAMIFQHAYEKPKSLTEAAPSVPSGAVAIVDRLLLKEPADRYQSAEDLIADLRLVRQGEEPSYVPARAKECDTRIILAPSFDANQDEEIATATHVPTIDQSWRSRLLAMFNQHAPEALKDLQNTQQQIDGGIAVYTDRRNKLAILAREARAMEKELALQIDEQESAVAAAQARVQDASNTAERNAATQQAESHRKAVDLLSAQLAEQKAQSEQIDLRLARVDTTLQRLRSQQQLLVARLETARAAIPTISKNPGEPSLGSFFARHLLALILFVVLGIPCLMLASYLALRTSKLPNTDSAATLDTLLDSKPPPTTEWLDLLSLIDVAEDTVTGTWKRSGSGITRIQKSGGSKSLRVPVAIDGSFELLATYQVKRGAPGCAVGFQLPFGTGHGMIVFGRDGKKVNCGINGVHGLKAGDPQNPTQSSAYKHTTGTNHDIRVLGELNGEDVHIKVWEHDRLLMDWTGRQQDIRSGLTADRNQDKRLLLSSWGNTATFSRLQLRMLDGEATVLREQEIKSPERVASVTGTWQISLLSGAQRGITLISMPDDSVHFRASGVFDGKYQWEGERLIVQEPEDKRFVGLVWQRDGRDLVLVEEPPDYPAGPSYVGARLKFILEDVSNKARNQVEKKSSHSAQEEYALKFSDESRYILNNDFVYEDHHPLTLEAWIAPEQHSDGHIICLFERDSVAMLQLRLLNNAWTIHARDHERDISYQAKSTSPVHWNKWTHVAGTYRPGSIELFVNGKSVASASISESFEPSGNLLRIGSDSYVRKSVFQGLIGQVRISKGLRYQHDFHPPSTLNSDSNALALYNLNEGNGNIAIDSSGHGLHGTIRAPQWTQATARYQANTIGIAPLNVPLPSTTAELLTSEEWEWTEPLNLGDTVNSKWREDEVFLSANGLSMLFRSDRPGGHGSHDLWESRRKSTDDKWQTPVNLGTSINNEFDNTSPSMSADNLCLLFTSATSKDEQRGLYIANRKSTDSPWGVPEKIEIKANRYGTVGYAGISPDGLLILLTLGTDDVHDRADIWQISRTSRDASWSTPVKLSGQVNTDSFELLPRLSADETTLLYLSAGTGKIRRNQIWISTRTNVHEPFGKGLVLRDSINLPNRHASGASLSADGRTLWFSTNRPSGFGNSDIWYSSRVPKSK